MRALTVLRAVVGATYLLVPQWIPGLLWGLRLDSRARLVVRILGARHLLQAAVLAASARPLILRLGSVVDALHATSMLGLAAVDDRRRRAALGDAAVASSLAAAGWAQAQQHRATAGG
ncbi:hypothetical protein GGC64_006231 [Mycobacterium sp. OAS707]|uniref:hypothetical protein n=1 Tax=Mycobacterium sp. OAS707 TaxID=2663822 RepID=UPI00178BAF1E|nr:hypothetical protein [Mycobacterium sp. OAS707]MBE1552144.1 hypothetical protein [Mycobacterium sp. OAS707]